MNDFLNTITARLEQFTLEEVIAVVRDFLGELEGEQQARFLALVSIGPRPLVAEAMGLADGEDLLASIQELHDALAAGKYVEGGVGYDPEYHAHRGYGDDSWIDEMDDLFAAATSLFGAGQFAVAAEAYVALFALFRLSEDGFLFTRPSPADALHTDVEAMKKNVFVAIGRADPDPAARAIALSDELKNYGGGLFALLDAWLGREELMAALEGTLVAQASQPSPQRLPPYFVSHAAELLREVYRRYHTLADYETLCRQVGAQQGWPFVDLVSGYGEQGNWEGALSWSEQGLATAPGESRYRPVLEEARGRALLRLGRADAAITVLRPLFEQQHSVSVYLTLREAAQASGQWEALSPRLVATMRETVLSAGICEEVVGTTRTVSWPAGLPELAALIGFAHLLEGEWQAALEWALHPALPASWGDDDVLDLVATGLLRMGLAAADLQAEEDMVRALGAAPRLVREHSSLLEQAARCLPADALLDGVVHLYEHLVERAAGGRNRASYATAASYCRMIRSVRRAQGREADFARYYQSVLATYGRLSAFKDEVRSLIEGPGYRRKR
jgi:tetratricopeptide (TPR) repeat protein